jgi:Reverse transcriptase (RNA-dependent DNA polymerase)
MSFKTIFAISTNNNWPIYKIDVKSAFTHGDLNENIYIKQPVGFEDKKYPNKVLKLNKALYGLKQAANIWFNTLYNALKGLEYTQLLSDNCLYQNKQNQLILMVYVDDIAITGPNKEDILNLIKELSKIFIIKNLGLIQSYLGIEITRDKNTTILNQRDYLIKVLKRFKMYDSKPISTPIDSKFQPIKYTEIASKEDIYWYQSAIGSLLYAALGTRPDITFTVNILGRFASNPSPIHITAMKRLFRYIKGHLNYGIKYSKTENSEYLKGYTDSDYGGDKVEYKSTSGYIFKLANGPISYSSKLQSITAQSSTEAEYIAICNATKEAIYLKGLLEEIGYLKQENIPIFSDNNGAILLSKNPIFHNRTKHINIRYHLIRQKIADNTINIHYINTKNQPADGLTKPLVNSAFQNFLELIGIALI